MSTASEWPGVPVRHVLLPALGRPAKGSDSGGLCGSELPRPAAFLSSPKRKTLNPIVEHPGRRNFERMRSESCQHPTRELPAAGAGTDPIPCIFQTFPFG